jgi:glycosyltransferase involved in cell wall biosynthesis
VPNSNDQATAVVPPNGAPLAGQDIIVFAHEPWHGPWKTYQQVLSIVAESNRVLYIGPPRSLREAIARLQRRKSRAPVLERVGVSLFVYHEPWLLARANQGRRFGRVFNSVAGPVRMAHARWLARRLGFDAPILWIFDAMAANAVGTFQEKLLVYYVLDNYVEFINPKETDLRSLMARNDEHLTRQADIVIAVSKRLQERCLRYNPSSFVVPNGVSYHAFQARLARGETPADMRQLPRPIVGYVGTLQSDIDFSLLQRISLEHPEWSLVFIGPYELGAERSMFDALLARHNVHYLGSKPVEDVPAYIGNCDVCLMPTIVDKSTVPDSDSIKLYEYLACGRPIVSTDTPSVRRFLPLVRIAKDAGGFIQCIEESLAEAPRFSELRKTAASEHSWERRVALLNCLIASQLSQQTTALGRSKSPTAASGQP